MSYVDEVIETIIEQNPSEPEFHQAVREVMESLRVVIEENEEEYRKNALLERLVNPERQIKFRVPWIDDNGQVQVNTGYRVQFNSAIGPYKGGLRFHPSVNVGIIKFLGFEQIFKNSLTGLPMGGGKGGSDFDPRGKSDAEILRFCRSFMTSLFKYIGPEIDVPAGDIGVGGREIGYLFGQYKRLTQQHEGVLTGKGLNWGGSLVRPEATGFGTMYFANEVLHAHGDDIKGKTIAISGFGNVAFGAVLKAKQLGAKVVTISGPDGYIYDESGINTDEKINYMLELRASNNDVVAPFAEKFGAKFIPGKKPWEVPVDMAFPCAIQNELNAKDAETLHKNGVKYVIETSNMGCTADAVQYFIKNRIIFAPGKAANAGGVAVSGLEMSQNSMKLNWSAEEVDAKLKGIMTNIHAACVKEGKESDGYINYVKGANIAGFKKVADAMVDLGY